MSHIVLNDIVTDGPRQAIGSNPHFLGATDQHFRSRPLEIFVARKNRFGRRNGARARPGGSHIIDLVGLPMRELRKRVAVLPQDSAIIYTSIFSDGEGTSYPPLDALGYLAEAANRPIVVAAETFVGSGGVGGYVLTPAAVGEEAAGIALRILNGESTSTIPIAQGDVVRPIFDWRELRRWGISESRLPEGSEIRFREPILWQRYRFQLLAICAALLVQWALITWLVYEHRRRRAAELAARNTMAELTHMNRMATAGELSASIAHELNQPLAGITMAASMASRSLIAKTLDVEKVKRTLDQIVDAGLHASELINTVRAMFKKDTTTAAPVDINSLVLVVLDLVRFELNKHNIELRTLLNPALPSVFGDPIQLQQVILNLVVNAIEAMQGVRLRVLTVHSELVGSDGVHVSIADTGTGIDPASVDRVFKPLFTTKANGMGMGLAICQSIIENHHGRIWMSAGIERGSMFGFVLPAMTTKHNVLALAS
jgi:signal transduction histidine kinase